MGALEHKRRPKRDKNQSFFWFFFVHKKEQLTSGTYSMSSYTYSLTHLLGGVMLLWAFSLLSQRRLTAMITLYQAEAITLAAAAFWQGLVQHAGDLYLTGLITLVIKALLLPMGLRQIVLRFNLIRAVETAMPVGVSMILGVALIGVAVLVVLPITSSTGSLTREDLAISLSVVLLGLLMMTTRRSALAQVVGFLSTENGLVLAATGMPGMPFVAELSVALLVLLAFLVVGVFVFRIREHFDSLDLSGIEDIERRGR
jgi:hydrogenase-4 component E